MIAGLPAALVRDFMRKIGLSEVHHEWAVSFLAGRAVDDPHIALAHLERENYIERAEWAGHRSTGWQTTTLGNALAMASFGRPIKRKTAERLVAEMLVRAGAYNADPGKLCYVERLRVFGSYLDPNITTLGDVDVELVLGNRVSDPEVILDYAASSGRSFGSFIDRLFWPQSEAVRFLRNGSTAINITREDIERLTDKFVAIYSIFEDSAAIPPPATPEG